MIFYKIESVQLNNELKFLLKINRFLENILATIRVEFVKICKFISPTGTV